MNAGKSVWSNWLIEYTVDYWLWIKGVFSFAVEFIDLTLCYDLLCFNLILW